MKRPSFHIVQQKLGICMSKVYIKMFIPKISVLRSSKKNQEEKKRIRRPEKSVLDSSIWIGAMRKCIYTNLLQISMADDLYLGEFEGK